MASDISGETIVFGGGCFWCTEAVFLMIKGVQSVEPGYAGPEYKTEKGPSYEEVSTGATPYVESAKVVYDPDQIAFPELLQVYFGSHDPTTPNRQGNDVGPQYRSAIFYTTERQKQMSEMYITNIQVGLARKIVTTVEPLVQFYVAEDYHKKYFENHKDAGYCQLVIAPKVEKVQEKFKDLLKK
ncbi:MAG TPA: peptide-methionine (S)-S-oxide reductase MsrA [Candidatus Paceibacterota bacterium]|nr:peptide-methionine (S)-S-oxide reductase MsrA [Candidatus Paceibacterota bacterium]